MNQSFGLWIVSVWETACGHFGVIFPLMFFFFVRKTLSGDSDNGFYWTFIIIIPPNIGSVGSHARKFPLTILVNYELFLIFSCRSHEHTNDTSGKCACTLFKNPNRPVHFPEDVLFSHIDFLARIALPFKKCEKVQKHIGCSGFSALKIPSFCFMCVISISCVSFWNSMHFATERLVVYAVVQVDCPPRFYSIRAIFMRLKLAASISFHFMV